MAFWLLLSTRWSAALAIVYFKSENNYCNKKLNHQTTINYQNQSINTSHKTTMTSVTSAPQVYGGDEVNALVLDPGSYSTRAGYAGEDTPRFVIPSYYGLSNDKKQQQDAMDVDIDYATTDYKTQFHKRSYTYYGDEKIHIPRENTEIKPIVNDEIIEDWDSAVEMFDFLFQNLQADIHEQPVLLTEPIWNTKVNKLKSLEIFLEFFKTPGFYLAKAPSCTSFAVGRPNSLIVDIGHNVTSVTPVLDGMCLSKNTMKTHYAGRFIDSQLRSSLAQRNIELVPRFKVSYKQTAKYSLSQFNNNDEVKPIYTAKSDTFLPKTITSSFTNFETQRVLTEMKETLLAVSETPINDSQKFDYQSRFFELPNGLQVEFEKERYEIANSLFTPTNYVNFWKKHPQYHFDDDLQWEEEDGQLAELDINNNYVPLKRGKKKEDNDTTATKAENGNAGDENNDNNDDESKKENGDAENNNNDNNNDNNNSSNNNDKGQSNSQNENGNKTANTNGTSTSSSDGAKTLTGKVSGLSALINRTIANIDVDIRQQVAHNIVVTGSLSLIPGLNDRISKDLNEWNPGLKIRLLSSGHTNERKYQNWIGGSIVASLGTFHQLWVSKAEYEEVGGERLITERFR